MSTGRERPPMSSPDDDALVQELERAAELERTIVGAARRTAASPDELRRVEALLRRAERADRPPERAPDDVLLRRRRMRLGLLAAGILLAAFVWRLVAGTGAPAPPRVMLGGDEVQVLAPEGAVDAFTRLRWRTSTQGTPRFSVRVVDLVTGALLLHEPDLQAFELSLEDHDTSGWQRIQVEVDELDSSGEPVESGRARAWRRSS